MLKNSPKSCDFLMHLCLNNYSKSSIERLLNQAKYAFLTLTLSELTLLRNIIKTILFQWIYPHCILDTILGWYSRYKLNNAIIFNSNLIGVNTTLARFQIISL